MSAIARGGGGRVHESVCISVLTRFRNNRSLFQIFLNAFRRGGRLLSAMARFPLGESIVAYFRPSVCKRGL